MEVIEKIIELINKARSILIVAHVGPDGDTLGSMLALKEILLQVGSFDKLDTVMSGRIPDIYTFLPGIENIKAPSDSSLYQNYDLAITVDCGALDRLGESTDIFRNAKMTANIDHHASNTKFAQLNWIEPNVSACGEIIYKLGRLMEAKITANIATDLYTAILTDTGGFKFENTKAETLRICADLIEAGADSTNIYKRCYESKSFAMIKLQAKAVDQAVFIDDNRIAYTAVSRELLDSLNANDDHIDGISETLRQVNTVEVVMVFKETIKGGTKVSFRSNGMNVCEIARFFGGGGHKLAAGCLIEKNIPDTINEILPIVRKQVNKVYQHS